MQISLNQMVEMLAEMANKRFDVPTQEMLKVVINYKRSDWTQKLLEKHPEHQRFYLKFISDDLVDVEESECPLPSSGCTVKRTSNKIPIPVRNSHNIFWYVGDGDKLDGYTYTTPDQLPWIVKYGSKYTAERPKYFFINGYIYIYNDNATEAVTIQAVWADQRQLNEFKCEGIACYTDDDQYDIPEDIINMIMLDTIKNELKLLSIPNDTEVTVDDKQN